MFKWFFISFLYLTILIYHVLTTTSSCLITQWPTLTTKKFPLSLFPWLSFFPLFAGQGVGTWSDPALPWRIPCHKKKKKVVKHRSEVKSFDYSAYFTVFCGLSDYDVLYMNCRGTMKKLGCTTWHLSRKSISPTSLFFLIMVSNCMLLSYHCGFKLSISIFICCCNIIML